MGAWAWAGAGGAVVKDLRPRFFGGGEKAMPTGWPPTVVVGAGLKTAEVGAGEVVVEVVVVVVLATVVFVAVAVEGGKTAGGAGGATGVEVFMVLGLFSLSAWVTSDSVLSASSLTMKAGVEAGGGGLRRREVPRVVGVVEAAAVGVGAEGGEGAPSKGGPFEGACGDEAVLLRLRRGAIVEKKKLRIKSDFA